jgi:hypothetical protein
VGASAWLRALVHACSRCRAVSGRPGPNLNRALLFFQLFKAASEKRMVCMTIPTHVVPPLFPPFSYVRTVSRMFHLFRDKHTVHISVRLYSISLPASSSVYIYIRQHGWLVRLNPSSVLFPPSCRSTGDRPTPSCVCICIALHLHIPSA